MFSSVSREKRHRDVLPEPPAALPPAGMNITDSIPRETSEVQPSMSYASDISSESPMTQSAPTNRFRNVIETGRNVFAVFRHYFSNRFPSHDPESEVVVSSSSNLVQSSMEPLAPSSYGPYPNKSSFCLGEWYWNHGTQKTQKNFKELVHIISDDDFQPSDIQSANWDKINAKLTEDGDADDGEWADVDAGWTASPITISVPFHRFTPNPGPRNFTVANFHHRSLLSVIREKLSDLNDSPHFHYEPYELLWQPSDKHDPVRIHGELYTSQAFIDAHNTLQESPGEPGCDLPHIVVALMFWSDSTVLANFGKAKLWPLYMFFGNESKYRRGKPSLNLCEHVAYFKTVIFSVLAKSDSDSDIAARFVY